MDDGTSGLDLDVHRPVGALHMRQNDPAASWPLSNSAGAQVRRLRDRSRATGSRRSSIATSSSSSACCVGVAEPSATAAKSASGAGTSCLSGRCRVHGFTKRRPHTLPGSPEVVQRSVSEAEQPRGVVRELCARRSSTGKPHTPARCHRWSRLRRQEHPGRRPRRPSRLNPAGPARIRRRLPPACRGTEETWRPLARRRQALYRRHARPTDVCDILLDMNTPTRPVVLGYRRRA